MSTLFPAHAEEAPAVARKALRALGRRRVLVSRGSMRLALFPVSLPRRIVAFGARRFVHRNAGRG
jgi:hypothetical protein